MLQASSSNERTQGLVQRPQSSSWLHGGSKASIWIRREVNSADATGELVWKKVLARFSRRVTLTLSSQRPVELLEVGVKVKVRVEARIRTLRKSKWSTSASQPSNSKGK